MDGQWEGVGSFLDSDIENLAVVQNAKNKDRKMKMNYQRWCECRPGRRGIFLALLGLLSFSLGAKAAPAAGQSSPPQGHAMGSAPCAWAIPIREKDNALDVAATIRALQNSGFNCVVQVIESEPPNSFADFKRLLSAAQPAGISVWPVLIPPTEGGNSLPYRTDYVGWMKEMAKLSLQYSALRGVNIDDLLIRFSAQTFTRAYLCQLYQAKQEINPQLLFVPTIYDLDQEVADRLAGCVDGVWFWWTNLEHLGGLRSLLEDSRLVVSGRFPIYSGVYANSTSWHTQGHPSQELFRRELETACRYADGAIMYCLPLERNSTDNLLEVARAFAAGGSADLAGKCGLGSTKPTSKTSGEGY
jgi:hypothetical protein